MDCERRSAIKGVAKSRSGSPPISVQTIVNRAKTSAFFAELRKIAEAPEGQVSDFDALEAARTLSAAKKRVRRHAESGLISATLAPGIVAAGRGVKAFADAKKGRFREAGKAVRDVTRGGLLQTAVTGGLTGAGISASREGLQLKRARNTYKSFLHQQGSPTTEK